MNRTLAGIITCLVIFASAPLMAADGTRIAVASAARIFSEMQERKDLNERLRSDQKLLSGVKAEKEERLRALQAAREALKADSPQYQEKNAELLKATIEYETWGKLSEANRQRDMKLQTRRLFEKIEQAVGEVARQKGYDLILTDQRPELPEDMDRVNMEQLLSLINARSVLYAGEKVDISSDVLALLDARYRAGSKAQPAPAQPAPAPTPAQPAAPTTQPR